MKPYVPRRWRIMQPGKRTRCFPSRLSAVLAMRELGPESGAVLRTPRNRRVPWCHIEKSAERGK